MTSLVKAIQERLAKVCDEIVNKEASDDGGWEAKRCAAAIRAADLSDLEPKEGETPLDELLRAGSDKDAAEGLDDLGHYMASAGRLAQFARNLQYALHAKEAECEAQRRDAERLDKLQSLTRGYGKGWKLRDSTSGRGMRLCETSQDGAQSTVRAAIDFYGTDSA